MCHVKTCLHLSTIIIHQAAKHKHTAAQPQPTYFVTNNIKFEFEQLPMAHETHMHQGANLLVTITIVVVVMILSCRLLLHFIFIYFLSIAPPSSFFNSRSSCDDAFYTVAHESMHKAHKQYTHTEKGTHANPQIKA